MRLIFPMDIVDAVAEVEGMKSSLIFERRRKAAIARARQMAMYLCSRMGMSSVRIGMFFERDHSTVLTACKRASRLIERDVAYGQKIAQAHIAAERIAGRAAA